LHVGVVLQDAGDDAQLVLQQVTAGGGSLTFRSSTAAADLSSNSGSSSNTVSRGSSDCTSFDFPVLLDGSSKHGNISARLLLPKAGLTLRLQDPILVHVPLLISLVTTSINVSSDYKPFKLGVSLTKPAPAGGASVQLILGEQGAAKVCTCSCVLHSLQCIGLQDQQQHAWHVRPAAALLRCWAHAGCLAQTGSCTMWTASCARLQLPLGDSRS
jgi:hypothetical protein